MSDALDLSDLYDLRAELDLAEREYQGRSLQDTSKWPLADRVEADIAYHRAAQRKRKAEDAFWKAITEFERQP